MTLTTNARNIALTTHISASLGWLGAVVAFLALAIAGLTSPNPVLVRSAYLAMELIGWFVIVPFSLASLLSGLIESFGTDWGLFRHYWIISKFVITILAVIILLVHMQPISYVARISAEPTFSSAAVHGLRIQIVADAGAAVLVLLLASTLSVFKPRGMTPYGVRKQFELTGTEPKVRVATQASWRVYILIGIITVILLFALLHLITGGMHSH